VISSEIAIEIIRAINGLPPDKVNEVRDFANFLKDRYGTSLPVEYSDAWTDEDIQDLTAAALSHAEQTIYSEDERYG
jgi:hypothetical protein